jgi:hypothetical protein
MSEVIKFPGVGEVKKEEEITCKQVFDAMDAVGLKEVFVVGIRENNNQVVISGNCTIAHGVYLAEVGKAILVQESAGLE